MALALISIAPHTYLDSAQVHWLLDDVMVVLETEGRGVHRLKEGPGIRLQTST